MDKVYLSRRNLLTLLSKLDRKLIGEDTGCCVIKYDNIHPFYAQSMSEIAVFALEDEEYYTHRLPGSVHPKDDPK